MSFAPTSPNSAFAFIRVAYALARLNAALTDRSKSEKKIILTIITDVFSVLLANEETNLYTFTCKKSVSATDKKPQAIEVESDI